MILSSAKTGMISLYKTAKYCYYFHKLLFTLFLVKIYPRRFLLDILQSDVQNAGCIVIKLVQWLHTRNDIFKDKSSINNSHPDHSPSQILEIFNGIYEYCKIHDMEYTRQVFAEEFSENFDDVIELDSDYDIRSGSVAQVYKGRFNKATSKADYGDIAIKVVHPDIQYQIIFPYIYYCAYHFLSRLRITTGTPFNIYSFFDNYIKQIDMQREADNMLYFYNEYRDNPFFIIPEPILWSKNILIMKYHDGESINDIEDTMSIYNKSNILLYMTLFVKSTIFTESLYHGDLHNGNWKIVKTNNNTNTNTNTNTNIPYRIIIYDFGYCIESNEKERRDFNNLFCSLDFNDISTFSSILYDYIERAPAPITRQEFIDKSVNMMKDNRTCLFDNDVFIVTVNYFIREKFVLSSKILDAIISIFLIEKLLKKYMYFPDLERQRKDQTKNNESIATIYNISHFNDLNQISHNYLTICETYNCFHKLQANLKNYIREIHTILDKNIDNDFKKYKCSQIDGNNNNPGQPLEIIEI